MKKFPKVKAKASGLFLEHLKRQMAYDVQDRIDREEVEKLRASMVYIMTLMTPEGCLWIDGEKEL